MTSSPLAFEKLFARVFRLNHLRGLAHWDEAVCMPAGGIHGRANAMSEIALVIDEIMKSKELADALADAEKNPALLSEQQKANLQEARRTWKLANVLDPKLIERQTQANIKSEQAWRAFRKENNWKDYLPIFKEVVALAQEEAQQRSAATGLKPYDAMMDLYQPGLNTENVSRWFSDLKSFLKEFIPAALSHQSKRKPELLTGHFPTDLQKNLGIKIMGALGFDFNHGRLDVSTHPFCGGVPEDVRITTRYTEDNFFQSLMGVVHESGHALYEQNLPRQWLEQPVGNSRGMAVHESQSLFMEMQMCRSPQFFQFAAPLIRETFQLTDQAKYSSDNLYRLATQINLGFIRVDSDEATYPLHVILRFEIERDLISGALKVEDIPEIWDQKMQEYLGISTKNNFKDGCLQDVHWPSGAFGYFPSYTVGAMIAAQLRRGLEKQFPSAIENIRHGDFKNIRDWLHQHVWSRASFISMDELLKQATGETINVEHLKSHLRIRYGTP